MPTTRETLESTVAEMQVFADQCDAKGSLSSRDHQKLKDYSERVTGLVALVKGSDLVGQMAGTGVITPLVAALSGDGAGTAVAAGSGMTFGAKAAKAVQDAGGEFGIKALVSGTVDVPTPIEPQVVRSPDLPTTFLDLITDRRTIAGTNTFNYLKQTVRTNNAAPVADGALKPTSVYTVAEIEDRVRVIAHLSEAIPERYFADHRELERFVTTEMQAGVQLALEDQVSNGTGVGENMTGILNTSGTTAVPYLTSTLTTARKAVTALNNINEQPNAWVLNPADDEAFDLLREDGTTGGFLLGQGEGLWRIPRVTSSRVPAGVAILGDWRQARLVVRENALLAADRSGDNFEKNLVKLRLEGRFGFAVLRPAAFAVVDLNPAL